MKKTMKYLALAMLALIATTTVTSCMDDDWKDPTGDVSPYGNNSLQEHNIISIADLKAKYAKALSQQNDTTRITDDIQIKGRVVSTDAGNNISYEIAVDDGTGSILVCITARGLYKIYPVGQEVLISLKDLYIGTYGYQPQIGTPYTSTSNSGVKRTFPSRINFNVWQSHFRNIGTADASKVTAEEFDLSKVKDANYIAEKCGKLMTFKNVTFAEASATKQTPFATEAEGLGNGNGVSRSLNGYSSSVLCVRTSIYAKFAAMPLPTTPVNITGIVTRYGSTVQILIREYSDVETIK